MKKILTLLLIILLLTGCSDNKINKEKEKYIKYYNELKNVKKSSNNIPFDIEIKYDKITNNEIRYQVIIDKVKIDLEEIEALAIHNKETNDVFPSIGIFDDKQNLEVNKKPSGIILVGYIDYEGIVQDFKCNIKVLVKYKTNKKTYKVYYVTKK